MSHVNLSNFESCVDDGANVVYVMLMSDDGHHGSRLFYRGTIGSRIRTLRREECSRAGLEFDDL